MPIRPLAFTALFVALGVLLGHLVYIPIGVAKCFPMQHAINVLLASLLGTRYAVSGAFTISLLRNLLGTGSILAFPGSLCGAFLAGWLFRRTGHIAGAVAGDVDGDRCRDRRRRLALAAPFHDHRQWLDALRASAFSWPAGTALCKGI